MTALPTLYKTPYDSLLYTINLSALLNSTGAGTIIGTPTISADIGDLEFGAISLDSSGTLVQVRISGGDVPVGYQIINCTITLLFFTSNVPDQLSASMILCLRNVL